MNKEIQYSGFSTAPADYQCPDGCLAASVNLLNEQNGLSALYAPQKIFKIQRPEESTALLIHKVNTKSHLIFKVNGFGDGVGIFWCELTQQTQQPQIPSDADSTLISTIKDIQSIHTIGNFIVVSTADNGLNYILWKDGTYHMLGARPPFVPIIFDCHTDYSTDKTAGQGSGEITFPVRALSRKLVSDTLGIDIPNDAWPVGGDSSNGSEAGVIKNNCITLMQNAIAARLNTCVAAASKAGRFCMPFFVRYAFRLYDGSYCWHSAPVLLYPAVLPPLVAIVKDRAIQNGTVDHDGNISFNIAVNTNSCCLALKILDFPTQQLDNWKDLVTAIDIFVSPPIYTFDQDKPVNSHDPILPWTELCRTYLENLTVEPSDTEACPGIFSNGDSGSHRGRRGHVIINGKDPNDDNTVVPDLAKQIIYGHYDSIEHFRSTDHTDGSGSIAEGTARLFYFNLTPGDKIFSGIRDTATFHKIASIPLEQLKPSADFIHVNIKEGDLNVISTLPTLPDDYMSHSELCAKGAYTYNARLNLFNLDIAVPKPLPPTVYAVANTAIDGEDDVAQVSVRIFSRVNGAIVSRVYEKAEQAAIVLNPAGTFPRYIFHPDPNAFRLQMRVAGDKIYTVNLRPHDFLNGAYYFGGWGDDHVGVTIEDDNGDFDDASPKWMPVKSKIYSSEVNNPLLFPAAGISTIPLGEVTGLASAAKALSQGQFGQFPLYAFSSEGVWALEISSTGTIVARQPITRDVCINPAGIAQLDSAVVFPTIRGLMLLSGSQSTAISDTINSDTPFNVLNLPGLSRFLTDVMPAYRFPVPFVDFLKNCSILYDYRHQRLIVYNPGLRYAYVMSLRTNQWGMTLSGLAYHLNSYPEAMAVNNDGTIVDLSGNDESNTFSLLVTRPLKLDAPNTLKTVSNVIQRGRFRKGNVKSILYGSRDLYNWHLVWSSKDHFLRGFSGTPYKYFRVALLCQLSPHENLFGCSVQFTPRLTNRPR